MDVFPLSSNPEAEALVAMVNDLIQGPPAGPAEASSASGEGGEPKKQHSSRSNTPYNGCYQSELFFV